MVLSAPLSGCNSCSEHKYERIGVLAVPQNPFGPRHRYKSFEMRSAALVTLLLSAAALGHQQPESRALIPGLDHPLLDTIFDKIFGKFTVKQLEKTLRALQKAADDNGGNRAFGLPGYDASVDHIWSQLQKFDKLKAFKIWKQEFTGLWNQITVHEFSVNGEEAIKPSGLTYSPSTPEGGLEAELVAIPGDAKPCSAEEIAATGIDVTDKILLIERGRCPDATTFAGKVKAASGAGAIAAIIYNSEDANITGGTLSAPNPEYIPAGLIQRQQALALRERILAGETLVAHYAQTQLFENRTTVNVFAETKAGNPNNVVMVGAHLDGVQAGPGINDDGSGTALILELYRTLAPTAWLTPNKLRFAWWGAEENGLVGSKHYVQTLPAKDVNSLLTYLNFDMVSKGFYGVFDGDGSEFGLVAPKGSDAIEKLFQNHFERKGLKVTPAALNGGSDYVHFLQDIGKPVGGLFTGTGVNEDPCYHQLCDTIDNPNFEQLYNNTLAAQEVFGILAVAGHKLIPKTEPVTGTVIPREAVQWTKREEADGTAQHTCHDEL
ncbi:hypothetical protein BDV98DRAFT_100343 [Pterulicium gracile]|uniref:Peptide hydrolase n=1 Tax=Pterulicium gracile TaxID=1884261 RepID=A0A5C3QIH3_9AGAR|nr:hypothetical protein BDV98DRAFT_100343 [Pterula gracilis]